MSNVIYYQDVLETLSYNVDKCLNNDTDVPTKTLQQFGLLIQWNDNQIYQDAYNKAWNEGVDKKK